jgi:hypothetical protein
MHRRIPPDGFLGSVVGAFYREVFSIEIVFSRFRLFAAPLLVVLNRLFVAAELSLAKFRGTNVESTVQEGKVSTGFVKR